MHWLVADAEQMPCEADSLDSYTIAFGIRNVTDIPAALQEAHRVRTLAWHGSLRRPHLTTNPQCMCTMTVAS